ncbi:MAG: sodium:solute symporter family protein [Verrucomicrobiaceae bacterium]
MLAQSLLTPLDWSIIAGLLLVSLGIGIFASRQAGKSTSEFFLSGRSMPWWLLGISMVATTFATDTPNFVTELVRDQGVSANWSWWALLISGMVTVFVFSKLWRRAGVMTDVEFYELRYSGKEAAFLRGFRALYLGLIFNVLIMGMVSLAAVKFGQIVLGIPAWQMLTICCLIVLIYSALGGLRGVILTDFVQFAFAMGGSIWAAIYLVNHERVGGMGALLSDERVIAKMSILPDFNNPAVWLPVFLVPLAVQWWASYFPGAEPGGGGYIAQRMFSAKNERHAMGATLLFNIAHYALRPWPWIFVALASILVFPSIDSIKEAFPNTDPDLIANDAAYPAMLTLLPPGLMGIVAASLVAAYMSTMSTQVNLGASYLVNDFYRRFLKPEASEKELVWAGRFASMLTLVLGCLTALFLTSARQAFDYIILLGAGTGAIYILRWFWWRVNAMTEIIAMLVSLILATYFTFHYPDHIPASVSPEEKVWWDLAGKLLPVALTTLTWVLCCYLTKPTKKEVLYQFYNHVKPGGPGWERIRKMAREDGVSLDSDTEPWGVPFAVLCAFIGCLTVYGALFSTGLWLYGQTAQALPMTIATLVFGVILVKFWKRA